MRSAVEAERARHGRVGLEAGQVVLLLQPRVAHEPRRAHAEAAQPARRDRVGHEHPRGQTAVERVLQRRELVVEHGRVRDAQHAAGHRQVGRAVRERHVEAAAAAERHHRRHAIGRRPGLAGARAAAVVADHRVLDAVELEQLERLRERAGGDRDVPSAVAQAAHERGEDHRVGGVGEVDPDAHARRPAYAAASAAARTAATTSRWAGSSSVGNIGSARPSSAARSVSGRSPWRYPRCANTGCR